MFDSSKSNNNLKFSVADQILLQWCWKVKNIEGADKGH